MKKQLLFFVLFLCIGNSSFAQYTKLLDFEGISKGKYPYGSLYSDGTFLYGMTSIGGTNDLGTIFKMKPDGTGFVKLMDFAGTANGSNPYGALISVGTSIYGMTGGGGINAFSGVLFKYGISTLSNIKNQLQKEFKIYPNPSNGNFNIEVDENLIGSKATVYNLLGQKVKSLSLRYTKTSQNLNKGIYILKIENEGSKITKKLIVN